MTAKRQVRWKRHSAWSSLAASNTIDGFLSHLIRAGVDPQSTSSWRTPSGPAQAQAPTLTAAAAETRDVSPPLHWNTAEGDLAKRGIGT